MASQTAFIGSAAPHTRPPCTSLWPAIDFERLSMTMSAPCSVGRQSTGFAKVLSTTQSAPAACACSATRGRGSTCTSGFAMVSPYTMRGRERPASAAAVAAGSASGAKTTSRPICRKYVDRNVFVAP